MFEFKLSKWSPERVFDLLSISWPSDRVLWKSIDIACVFEQLDTENTKKSAIFRASPKWFPESVFWVPSLAWILMTSELWLIVFEFFNQIFGWSSIPIWHKKIQKCLWRPFFNFFSNLMFFQWKFIMGRPSLSPRKLWTIPKVFNFDLHPKYQNTKISYSGFHTLYYTVVTS